MTCSTDSLSSPESRSWWKKDIRMAVWHNSSEAADDKEAGANSLKVFLAKAKNDLDILRQPDAVGYISLEIGKQLMKLLLRSMDALDITLPLDQLGMDSLVGIEMRTWWKQTLGSDVNVLQLLDLGTLEGLGKHAADQLLTAIAEAQA